LLLPLLLLLLLLLLLFSDMVKIKTEAGVGFLCKDGGRAVPKEEEEVW